MGELVARDLGRLPYREAWAVQEEVHAKVVEGGGGEGELLLVEHPPVITFGRRAEESARHLVASGEALEAMGVEVVESDRGGDITFHGPGQLVVYPIVRLADLGLSVGGYVRRLQEAVVAVVKGFGIEAGMEEGAVGVWCPVGPRGGVGDEARGGPVGKVCAVGVRVKRGVTMHGVALNVTTDLRYFDLIVPCGLTGRPVTSLRKLSAAWGVAEPTMEEVKERVIGALRAALAKDEGQRGEI